MKQLVLNVLNEGFSPEEMNAVRGGGIICTCYGSTTTYDCGCRSEVICDCFSGASLTCSCDSKAGIRDNSKPGGPETGQ